MKYLLSVFALVFALLLTAAAFGATTWQWATKLSTVGGTLQYRDQATQTASGIIVYKNYTTTSSFPVRVRSNTGYLINYYTLNGVQNVLQKSTALDFSYKSTGAASQTLLCAFKTAPSATVTTSFDPLSISIDKTSVNTYQAHSAQFRIIPLSGYYLTGVNVTSDAYMSLQDANTLQQLPLNGKYSQSLLLNIIAETGSNIITIFTVHENPPVTEGEDVTDPQMTAFFTNMSTQAAKVTASNSALGTQVYESAKFLLGGLLVFCLSRKWTFRPLELRGCQRVLSC